jgi:hypothetical protein
MQENKDKCCPDCIPTGDIPDVCKPTDYGAQILEQTTSDNGVCVSTKKYKMTGCSGRCRSSVKASLDSSTFVPGCKCCQPTNVRQFNVTLTCENKVQVRTTFYEILSCSCQATRCDSSFNLKDARESDESDDYLPKSSLLRSIEMMPDLDDETARRQRRSLLNDLALVHAKKRRR